MSKDPLGQKKLGNDFLEFLGSTGFKPNPEIADQLKNNIAKVLSPSPIMVLRDISLIHLVSSIFTLSLCSQFGLKFFSFKFDLGHFFMRFGSYGCVALCGMFYLSSSLLMAYLVLSKYELAVFYKNKVVQSIILIFASLGIFIMVAPATEIQLGLLWSAGALFGSQLTAIVGHRLLKWRVI